MDKDKNVFERLLDLLNTLFSTHINLSPIQGHSTDHHHSGLGVMGYPMAVNLRSKIGPSYKILICDISKDAISKYQTQVKGKGAIDVVPNGFEATQAAVSLPPTPNLQSRFQ